MPTYTFQTRFLLLVGFIREGLFFNVQCWSDNVWFSHEDGLWFSLDKEGSIARHRHFFFRL